MTSTTTTEISRHLGHACLSLSLTNRQHPKVSSQASQAQHVLSQQLPSCHCMSHPPVCAGILAYKHHMLLPHAARALQDRVQPYICYYLGVPNLGHLNYS
jgi:hypothetical protein